MLFREGSGKGDEKQWEKLHQALPAAPKQPEMKFLSVGEDLPGISTLPQFLWKRRASLGGKMPGDERYGEGLRIAGAGDRCPRGLFPDRVTGRAWSSPALPRAPGSIQRGGVGTEPGVARHRIHCRWCPWVITEYSQQLIPTKLWSRAPQWEEGTISVTGRESGPQRRAVTSSITQVGLGRAARLQVSLS